MVYSDDRTKSEQQIIDFLEFLSWSKIQLLPVTKCLTYKETTKKMNEYIKSNSILTTS